MKYPTISPFTGRAVNPYFDLAGFRKEVEIASINLRPGELAHKTGLSRDCLYDLLHRREYNPHINTFLKICYALELDEKQFFKVQDWSERNG